MESGELPVSNQASHGIQIVKQTARVIGITLTLASVMVGALFVYIGLSLPDDSYWPILKLLAIVGGGVGIVLGIAGLAGVKALSLWNKVTRLK